MKEKDYRKTSYSLSFLMLNLYGQKSYSEIKNYQDVPLLKKYCIKLIKSFRYAINETIEIVDKNQFDSLNRILNHGEKIVRLSKNFSDLDQKFISMQAELIFQLIGNMPNRWQANNVINRKDNWKLNDLRQIQYVQNIKHKEKIIFKLINQKYMGRFGDWSNFVLNVYWKECHNNPEKLIEFLKKNHPDIYYEII